MPSNANNLLVWEGIMSMPAQGFSLLGGTFPCYISGVRLWVSGDILDRNRRFINKDELNRMLFIKDESFILNFSL